MKETNCDVIRDLLPLYEDNVVSEETAQMVREHLKDCPECREELRKMRTPISLPPDEDEEAVKRFLEHRAEIRKKQNVKIAWFLAVVGSIISAGYSIGAISLLSRVFSFSQSDVARSSSSFDDNPESFISAAISFICGMFSPKFMR